MFQDRENAVFQDREDAGWQLAEQLKSLPLRDPLVLGIPRGGVVTAAALARALGAELDVVLAHKLRAPRNPELAFGAVGEVGEIYLNHDAEQITGVMDEYLESERRRQMAEIERRQRMFRPVRPAVAIADRTVILTDDGIATGSTMLAAIKVVRAGEPHELIVAVPIGPPDRIASMRPRVDRLICLHAPYDFLAVGQFYRSFEPVEVEEVVAILREFAAAGESSR